MATTLPSDGEKPPDHAQKKRLNIAYKPQLGSPTKSNPATDFNLGGDISVAKNRLGASENSQFISGSNLGTPCHGDCSPPKELSFHQISDQSTARFIVNDQLNISGDHQLVAHGATGVQIEQNQFETVSAGKENVTNPSPPDFNGSIATTLQKRFLQLLVHHLFEEMQK